MKEQLLTGFMAYEGCQRKEIRGGVVMYDVKGCHKYLTVLELFDIYLSSVFKTA